MSREWNRLDQEMKDIIGVSQEKGPVKLSQIAQSLAVEVKSATLKPGISGEIRKKDDGSYRIRVNRHDPKKRQRFTVAHELAHFLLHRDKIGDGIEDDKLYRSTLSDSIEHEANRLAADILMPKNLIDAAIDAAEEKGLGDKILFAADELNVSESAMAIRFEVLGLDPDDA